MLTIRLQRVGKKHQPSYRVVVSERRSKLGGPPIEDLGFYNPFTKTANIKKDRVEHWTKVGAKCTPTVHNLCVAKGVIAGAKLPVKLRKKKVEAETVVPAEAKKEEAAAPVAPAA